MAFALGFILGFLLAYLPQWVRKPAKPVQPDEAALRRQQQALREYRNFMTYDGYSQQESNP